MVAELWEAEGVEAGQVEAWRGKARRMATKAEQKVKHLAVR